MSVFYSIFSILIFISGLILLLFNKRKMMGLAPLFILLGTIQYFQTVLARGYNIHLFDGYKISPGSVVLFSSTLFALLLVYIKEGVPTTRTLIFGIVIANISIGLLSLIVSSQFSISGSVVEVLPDSKRFLFINMRIFIVGSLTLLLDFYLTIILYKLQITKFSRIALFPAIFTTLLIVMTFDSIVFVTGSFFEKPHYVDTLISQLIGKGVAAAYFSLVLYLYLKFVEVETNKRATFIADQSEDLWSIITYRKKYEILKVQKENVERDLSFKLENALNSMTDGFISLDKNWRHTYVNKRAAELLGKTQENLIGSGIENGYSPEGFIYFKENYLPVYEEAMRKQEYLHLEEYYLSADKWYENHVYPSADGVSIYFRDITARKKAEQELEENRIQLQTLSDNLPYSYLYQLVVLPGGQTRVNFLSSNIELITGKYVEQLKADFGILLNHIKKEDRNKLEAATQLSRGQVKPINLEIKFDTHKNETKYMLLRVIPRNLDNGSTLWDGIFTDITDLKKAESEKLLLSSRNDLIISFMMDGFILGDIDGNIIDVNPAYCHLTGRTRRELLGMNIFQIDNFYSREELRQFTKKLLAEKSLKMETSHLKKDGSSINFEVSIGIMPFNEQNLIAAFFRDITEQNKVQLQIRTYNTQLSQLTAHLQRIREEERRRIGREIHDDLGQRLTAIKMDVAWVNKKIDDQQVPIKEKMKNMIELIDGSNLAVRRILNELKPSLLEEYGLFEAIHTQANQFTENTGIPVDLATTGQDIGLEEELAICVFRIFQECLTNITKYANAKFVEVSVWIGDTAIRVNIKDDGIGFQTEVLAEKKSYGIIGMRERIRAMSGYFEIKSERGKGTVINFELPLKQKTARIKQNQ